MDAKKLIELAGPQERHNTTTPNANRAIALLGDKKPLQDNLKPDLSTHAHTHTTTFITQTSNTSDTH